MLSCNFKLLKNIQSRNYISKKLNCSNELVSKQTFYYMMNIRPNWNRTHVIFLVSGNMETFLSWSERI